MSTAPPIFGRWLIPVGGRFGADRRWVGPPSPPTHTGVDHSCPRGTPLPSMLAGRVVSAGWSDALSGIVYRVVALDGVASVLHAHLDGVDVGLNVVVGAETRVGITGATGSASTGPHVHTEYCVDHRGHFYSTDCYRAGTLRDPLLFLGGGEDDMFTDADRAKLEQAALDASEAKKWAIEAYQKADAGGMSTLTWLTRVFFGRNPATGKARGTELDDGR